MTAKVLIADDEQPARDGLRDVVSSLDGFTVVAVASDGAEAVRLAEPAQPDICILDVKMPELTGLEALERIRAFLPEVRCIIYSGHDEFQYAQSAIKLKADDYILKPATTRGLTDALLRLWQEVETGRRLPGDKKGHHHMEQSMAAVEEVFYRNLVSGDMPLDQLEEQREMVGRDVGDVRVWIVSLDDAHQLRLLRGEREIADLRNRMKSTFRVLNQEKLSRRIPLLTMDGNLVALFDERIHDTDYALFVRHEIQIALDANVSVAVGDTASLEAARKSYESANRRLAYRLSLGGRRVFGAQDDEIAWAQHAELPASMIADIRKSVRYIDRESVAQHIGTIMGHFRAHLPDPDGMRRFCFQIYEECHFLVRECVPDLDDHLSAVELSRDIHEITSPGDLRACLADGLEKMMNVLETRSRSYSLALKKALDYIDRNYRSEFSLKDLARHVQLNPSYLSNLISHESGKTFIEHVTGRRIDEAKKLLAEGDYNVSEIAYRLGYETPRYFSMVFKKNTGLTPSDFRRTAAGAEAKKT